MFLENSFRVAQVEKTARLYCFRYIDSTISQPPDSKISSFWHSSVAVQCRLCRTWSEIPNTRFVASRLISISSDAVAASQACMWLLNSDWIPSVMQLLSFLLHVNVK